jgi:hypothetical protein
MPDTENPRRSVLSWSWRAVSEGPRAYFRPWGRALDLSGIERSWGLMRDVQQQAFKPERSSGSPLRLIEKNGRLDVEATRAWMEAFARRQFDAGRTTQDVLQCWETAPPAAVMGWAVHEIRGNRSGVHLKIAKAAACAIAAFLSAWLVERPDMAVMSSIVLMLFCVVFVIASIRAVRNQVYLESLVAGSDYWPDPGTQKVPGGRLAPAPGLYHGDF